MCSFWNNDSSFLFTISSPSSGRYGFHFSYFCSCRTPETDLDYLSCVFCWNSEKDSYFFCITHKRDVFICKPVTIVEIARDPISNLSSLMFRYIASRDAHKSCWWNCCYWYARSGSTSSTRSSEKL